ncbi:MAG: hypothetical protein IJE07_00870 [Clostridia bacterium]|nr:hypothetical protein [Clostridia bacterium]
MNGVWKWCVFGAVVYGLFSGNGDSMSATLMTTGEEALQLTMILTASMTLWGGLMEILCQSGDLTRLGGMLRRIAGPVFPGLQDRACWEAMGTNIAANMLGMGNAATPAGICAAKLLAGQGETGLRALAALLVVNNAGLQLLPTTVIAMRQAAGSADPGSVWVPSLAASGASALVGLATLLMWQGRGRRSMR